jgi:tRNA threonylcarbamoyladenosine biosynthesis protein TsaB
MIDEVLGHAGIGLSELSAIAYGHGPGSFTGVRIASGIIQGLAIGTELPVIGISTMAAMAQQGLQQYGCETVSVAIDARMNEVYFGQYQQQQGIMVPVIEERVTPPEEANQQLRGLNSINAVGTGWAAYPDLCDGVNLALKEDIAYPNAEYMLPLAYASFNNDGAVPVEQSQPVYLRDKVTWKKLPGR